MSGVKKVEMSELVSYALQKYGITPVPDRLGAETVMVLNHPVTGRPIAFLMRQWDSDSGTMLECCDIKCGADAPAAASGNYISRGVRMQSANWVNVLFCSSADPDVVCGLFDRAVKTGDSHGFTIVIDPTAPFRKTAYSETPIPYADSGSDPAKKLIPQKLRQLRRMFEYSREITRSRAEAFYKQAVFMKDYEDDVQWEGAFSCAYPSYSDLTTVQLRGYFTWRTAVRKGEYGEIPASAAYIYIYELLNGIGADSPADILQKLKDFEKGFIDAGYGTEQMRNDLRRWRFELAVISGFPADTILHDISPDIAQTDENLLILKEPAGHTDEEVAGAMRFFGGKKYDSAAKYHHDKADRLFSEIWRTAVADKQLHGQDVFTRCFGTKRSRYWYPLQNALYYDFHAPGNMTVRLGEHRTYEHIGVSWYETSFSSLCMDSKPLLSFLRETDALLRRHFRTGHYLKEKRSDKWVDPFVNEVINSLIEAEREAARPKINIDLTGLEKIRSDALVTRDSLLTEEELAEMQTANEPAPPAEDTAENEEERVIPDTPEIPLDAVHIGILRRVLQGQSADDIMKKDHLMPSIAADTINEALYDEIGDTVLECEDDKLTVVEDYREDVIRLLGGI